LILRELSFGYFAGEVVLDDGEASVEEGLLDVAEDDVEAGACADMGDAVAHGSCAEDCDGFDYRHRLFCATLKFSSLGLKIEREAAGV